MKKYGILKKLFKKMKSPFKKKLLLSRYIVQLLYKKRFSCILKRIEILKMDIKKDIVSLCI